MDFPGEIAHTHNSKTKV